MARPAGIRRAILATALAVPLVFGPAGTASAGLVSGLMRIVGGVLEIPRSIVAGTLGGPPIVGTLAGVIVGAVRGTGMVAFGAVETAVGTIPLALKALPFLPFVI